MSFSSRLLLDTDTISFLRRGHITVAKNAAAYLALHQHLTFSEISRYEILRGMLAHGATKQIALFETFCVDCEILPITWQDLRMAAGYWADLRVRGHSIGDADLIVAATAAHLGWGVATHNASHFSRISGLKIIDWTQPQP